MDKLKEIYGKFTGIAIVDSQKKVRPNLIIPGILRIDYYKNEEIDIPYQIHACTAFYFVVQRDELTFGGQKIKNNRIKIDKNLSALEIVNCELYFCV